MQKLKTFLKKITISIAVTSTIVISIFYFEINIDTMIELADSVDIDVTTTIHFN
ncbi:hypothetical protein [Lentibacillus sp. CBA3610]|uniref:hypothetical protein n=1 Tax=Lentibacillus sp. CBA3610 TaxID=2518176 RepID=UPI001595315E|nr:hypothetical protein [Lentibacillus sp. CBA3610]